MSGQSLERITREIVKTDEIRGKARTSLRTFCQDLERWRGARQSLPHTELMERILDESGYTQMWRDNKDAKSAGRLENLKELIQAMAEFDSLEGYLEHVSLVLDVESGPQEDEISLMTLHSAKGLEFPLVFLPGWEEGTFPSQKSLDENGLAGLEEERRLAYVGITRAREQAQIYFVANRQIYGSWQSALPSRFIDELPPDHVDAQSETGYYQSQRVVQNVAEQFSSSFETSRTHRSSPGWERYKQNAKSNYSRSPREIEGRVTRKTPIKKTSDYKIGDRIFHQKFGYGDVVMADGDKLDVEFDKAGSKKVLDGFVERA